ncbi:MAG: hypothetical protein CBD88_00890 [Flavobacteriales bacterium TMED228]|nr:MAG: hypothetical protein CBD88_00890 [Flavobacteriales bacterium TMED228]|tara:strand:+ start:1107 stop:2765 length:1659 start_codon:yes stop_codon:yes gene_type:complete
MKEKRHFVTYHKPCRVCGSSDAVSINNDDTARCFSCEHWYTSYHGEDKVEDFTVHQRNSKETSGFKTGGSFQSLKDRNIAEETARKYGVKSEYTDDKGKHYYPYYIANEVSGTKIRNCTTKEFNWIGSPKGVMLFGQQLFQKGGKFLTICEGECDAMAAHEMMDSKWPVVSIKNGVQGALKDIKENLEFVESFDFVVINFDNDNLGKKKSIEVADLLSPGKAKILTLPDEFKDANDMLRNNRRDAYKSSWWNAKAYTPAGVLNISEMKKEYFTRKEMESIPYPWQGLNDKLYGLRQGELVTLTGGTGLGKSSVTRELEHWILKNTNDNLGILALEENWQRTVDGLLSIEANTRLYIKQIREDYPTEKLNMHYETLYGKEDDNRLWVHSHLGEHNVDELFSKIRYMVQGLDCKWIIVDHLGMMTSALSEGDERRAIDNIMTRLRSLVEETGAGLVLVSHLRRIDGNRGHEQGAEVSLAHLRGSNGISQISDCVIALERNQQSDDVIEASTTRLRILKSRYTGDVGLAGALHYDKQTGRLKEVFDFEDGEEVEL